ncbi:PIN domain-containing protein [Aeromonas sp. sif2433]|uniref:PIN domain-containing protein n=1 Tax=Aeromonas sp. sif2433 TaxID=2854794 RepID=UPI001C43C6AA|nr:PIN domain-containing protein [Aeromonas sp. sif2433]MBV7413626.1 DUF4935 domain-containing protein [Aeromonas sp. sif2433]
MTTELQSRLVFIDTSAFESKNFQFDSHKLEQLCGYLKERKLHLLTTEITIKEVRKHIRAKSKDAASAVKKIRKEAMFLRNTPHLDCYGIFKDVKEDDIYDVVSSAFDRFLKLSKAEIVPIGIVDSSIIFDNYFNEKPPFSGINKKNEFPDAFVLEAVRKVSEERRHDLYVISCDGDMKAYSEQYDGINHLSTVDELLDLVIRNEEELKEPVRFADKVFKHLEPMIIQQIRTELSRMDFNPENEYYPDVDIKSLTIESVDMGEKNIVEVSSQSATYEVKVEFKLSVEYLIANYDDSPWDPEDKEYIFIIRDQLCVVHEEEKYARITLDYYDAIVARAEIEEIEFSEDFSSLDIDNGFVSSHQTPYDPHPYEDN